MSKRRLYKFLKPKKVDADFECAICCELLLEPVKLLCTHVICDECIKKLSKNESICPMCRKKFDLKEVKKAEDIIQDFNEVLVLCEFEHCDWIGPLKELELHEVDCAFSPKKCRKEVLDLLPTYDKGESNEVSSPCFSLVTQLFKNHPEVMTNILLSEQRSQQGKQESSKARLAKTSDPLQRKILDFLV